MASPTPNASQAPIPGPGSLPEKIARTGDILSAICLGALVLGLFTTVLMRNVLKIGLIWMDDLVRYLQIWMVWLAAVGLVIRDDHISMDALYRVLGPKSQHWLRVLYGAVSLGLCIFMTVVGWEQAEQILRANERSRSGMLPAILGYSALPISFLLMSVASLNYLLNQFRKPSAK